jgi:hypothetical protein
MINIQKEKSRGEIQQNLTPINTISESSQIKKCNINANKEAINSNRIIKTVTLYKRFENSMMNFLDYSTIGGLAELGKRKSLVMRVFWIIVVLVCFSYAILTILNKINLYSNYEVVLVEYKYQEMPSMFPSVTVCNLKPFNEKYTYNYLKEKFNFTGDLLKYALRDYSSSNAFMFEYSFDLDTMANKIPSIETMKRTILNNLNETQLQSIGFGLDRDLLISCRYNGNYLCSEANGCFKKFWNNVYGNCYTFSKVDDAFLTGLQFGLQMEIVVSM